MKKRTQKYILSFVFMILLMLSGCGFSFVPRDIDSPGGAERQEIISFEEVQPMFEAHKEDIELLYSTFEKKYAYINIGFNRNLQMYTGGFMLLDASYVSFENVEPEAVCEYMDDREAADAAARVLSEMDGLDMSYVKAEEDLGREATFIITLYPGIVSIEHGTTASGYEDLWKELGDEWFYAVWRNPDG